MNKVAIAFSTKNRLDKMERSIEPLIQPDNFDLFVVDGSTEPESLHFIEELENHANGHTFVRRDITGGSCRAIVYALTLLLEHENQYDYVGLVESDVLLDGDWFDATMHLFGHAELPVGAASARCYEDRILIQRDGYAIMHNLGAGMIMFTREAASIVLRQYRTHMTTENRRIFSLASGIDIGPFWAFKGSDHMLVADWGYDRHLVEHGLCSLALTPAKATQMEDIARMGLTMAAGPVKERENPEAYKIFRDTLRGLELPKQAFGHLFHANTHVYFPHQISMIGGNYAGGWQFKWSLGWGCFAWQAGPNVAGFWQDGPPIMTVPLMGPCEVIVSGGSKGARCKVEDEFSGFSCEPTVDPEGEGRNMLAIAVPGNYTYRHVKLTALTPGLCFFGVRTAEAQPSIPGDSFNFHSLPPLP